MLAWTATGLGATNCLSQQVAQWQSSFENGLHHGKQIVDHQRVEFFFNYACCWSLDGQQMKSQLLCHE